jgi:single-stranded DNA-binding protein
MISALITGTLFRTPEQRESKSGKFFTKACLKIASGETSQFVSLIAFGESAQAGLLSLHDGDALSAQGTLKCELYEASDGSKKLSLNLTVSQILPLKQPARERKQKAEAQPAKPGKVITALREGRSKAERCAGTWSGLDDGPNDDVPF